LTNFILGECLFIDGYGKLPLGNLLADSGDINKLLIENGIDVRYISLMNSTLEDYFIGLTGGAINV
jgi:hypothetical protein